MNKRLATALLTLVAASLVGGSIAWAEGTPSNGRERFFLKRQNCAWTDEMGKFIYECVKKNDGFNAHWCHNEAIDAFCPADENAVPHPAQPSEKPGEPEAGKKG